MKKNLLFSVTLCLAFGLGNGQTIGVGTASPDASAALDITNTVKGLLIPRMATGKIASIPNPAKGLLVYDSSRNQLMVNMGRPAAPNWQTIVANSGWNLTGNGGASASNFIGTTDSQSLILKINNQWAGKIDSATSNVFIGYGSGANSVGSAIDNTAIGYKSLNANSTGFLNTATGSGALQNNTTGYYNTGIGQDALFSNTTGNSNTANGSSALFSNMAGYQNTANGYESLYKNTSGSQNTANGYEALLSNTTGTFNTSDGWAALAGNSTGSYNTVSGELALFGNTTGNYNTGIGNNSLSSTTASDYNTAVGYHAGTSYDNGYNNVFIGANTDVNGAGYYNVIAIGQGTIVTGSSLALFGNSATITYGGWAGWTNISDGRFKTNVKENVPGLAFILKLRPITYNLEARRLDAFIRNNKVSGNDASSQMYEKALEDKEKITYTGFVAQEVESNANQLGYDFSGVDKPKSEKDYYGLRYADFVAPLVKAVQELSNDHKEIKKEIEELKALLQKKGQ